MKKTTYILGAIVTSAITVGCATSQLESGYPSADAVVKSSWHNVPDGMRGRLVQDEAQQICSAGKDNPSKEIIARSEALAKAAPVVLPKDGLGTGLAKLKQKAPQTYAYLKQRLLEEFGFDNDNGTISQKLIEPKQTENWEEENNDCPIPF